MLPVPMETFKNTGCPSASVWGLAPWMDSGKDALKSPGSHRLAQNSRVYRICFIFLPLMSMYRKTTNVRSVSKKRSLPSHKERDDA